MLKSFNEMMEIPLDGHTEKRKAKDENGREVEVEYLPWAECKLLLHQNGATFVDFTPLENANGSYVFEQKQVETSKGSCCCPFVKVRITIDDMSFDYSYPLMNGTIVVRDETLNQLRISNAHARAFVKGVAVRTGLGFKLWLKDDETAKIGDDLRFHNILAIKQRTEERVTELIRYYGGEDKLLSKLEMNKKQFETIMKSFGYIQTLEARLGRL